MLDWLEKPKSPNHVDAFILEDGSIVDTSNPEKMAELSNVREPTVVRYRYNDEMAMGVVVPKNAPAAATYLENLKDYNDLNLDIYKQINLSRKLYVWEGVVGTIIDMLCDFSTSKIIVEGLDGRAKKIIDFMFRDINSTCNNITTGLQPLSRMSAFCYFVDGNVIIYRKWSKVKYGNGADVARIPLTCLPVDPLIIEIPNDSIVFGNKKMYLKMDQFKTLRKSDNKDMPLKFRKALDGRSTKFELNDDEVYHIKRRGSTFGGWGIPYLTRSFGSIASKRRLRALDDHTTEGLINSITIFKVGDSKNELTWKPERIEKLKSMLANPSPSLTLVWAYDLEVDHVGPEGSILSFTDKYKQVDRDIMSALGVSPSIVTGEGSERVGDVWVALMVFLERIEEFHNEWKEFIRKLVKDTLKENGIENQEPIVRIPMKVIRSEDIRNKTLSAWDRGLLSPQTALEEMGHIYEEEKAKKIRATEDGDDKIWMPPMLPFSNNRQEQDPRTPDEKRDNNTIKKPKNEINMRNKRAPRTEALLSNAFFVLNAISNDFGLKVETDGINRAAIFVASKINDINSVLGPDEKLSVASEKLIALCQDSNSTSFDIYLEVRKIFIHTMEAVQSFLERKSVVNGCK